MSGNIQTFIRPSNHMSNICSCKCVSRSYLIGEVKEDQSNRRQPQLRPGLQLWVTFCLSLAANALREEDRVDPQVDSPALRSVVPPGAGVPAAAPPRSAEHGCEGSWGAAAWRIPPVSPSIFHSRLEPRGGGGGWMVPSGGRRRTQRHDVQVCDSDAALHPSVPWQQRSVRLLISCRERPKPFKLSRPHVHKHSN